jgi:protein-tyrosine phosphatase
VIRVLFVCTGNICRSPMAEGVLRGRAAAHGLDRHVETDSAGTHDYHVGEPPDHRAQASARARGYDLSGQRARRVRAEDFELFDYLVALDRGHLAHLRRLCPPGREDRLHLLLDFADRSGGDVPDPYYGDDADFEIALDLVERGVDGILALIREAHPTR